MLDLPKVAPPANLPACAQVPDASQLKSFGFFSAMSAKDTATLNLTFPIATGSGNFSLDSQVVIWRMGQSAECPSTDGKYTLVYGSEWDAGIIISQTNISGNATFAVVAANATINRTAVSFNFSTAGYTDDSDLRAANSKLFTDVSANGLDVTNFNMFQTDFTAAVGKGSAATTKMPLVMIGYRLNQGTDDILRSLEGVYALPFIALGRGCLDAVKAYPNPDSGVDSAIRATYSTMSGGKTDCDASDAGMQGLAKQLLGKIQISNK